LQTSRRRLTYGFAETADVRGANLVMDADGCHFAVRFADRTVTGYHLPLHGRHNAQNALAAIAIANDLNIPDALVQKALATFSGVKRRFSLVGSANGLRVIDDYGHHPVEIAAVLQAARGAAGNGNIIAVVQPHRYSRLHNLMAEIAACVRGADHVLVADVYAAGEAPIAGASAAALVERMRANGHPSAHYLPTPEALPARVQELAKPGDMVVCLGAGSITTWAHALPDALKKLAEAAA
jgi:UDP-N-acetylmuramate--alanine ligase